MVIHLEKHEVGRITLLIGDNCFFATKHVPKIGAVPLAGGTLNKKDITVLLAMDEKNLMKWLRQYSNRRSWVKIIEGEEN